MVSSLAAQLAQGASFNAPILSETQRKKHASVSYLFASSKQGTDDLDALHALSQNAFAQLVQLNSTFSDVEEQLFSHRAREVDRTLLRKPEVEVLDDAIEKCLKMLGPYVMEDIAGRVLEWLVKRFRINEFNVPQVLALFLPYHESPHFAKMVTILHIDQQSPFAFLLPYKSAAKPLSRGSLVAEMLKSSDLTRSVISLLPEAFTGIGLHRTIVCFNTSIMLEYVTRATTAQLNAETVAMILPAFLTPLGEPSKDVKGSVRKDCLLGSFVLLSALSQRCRFSPAALMLIVKSMIVGSCSACAAGSAAGVDSHQLLTALTSVLSPHDALNEFPSDVVEEFARFKKITGAIRDSFAWAGVEKVYLPMLPAVMDSIMKSPTGSKKHAAFLECILSAPRAPSSLIRSVISAMVQAKIRMKDGDTERLTSHLSAAFHRHGQLFQDAMDQLIVSESGLRNEVEAIVLGLASNSGGIGISKASDDVRVAMASSDSHVRAAAVRKIVKFIEEGASDVDKTSLQQTIQSRVPFEDSPIVLAAIYESRSIAHLLTTQTIITAISSTLTHATRDHTRAAIKAHLEFFCNDGYESNRNSGADVVLELVLPFAYYTKRKWKTTKEVWDILRGSKLYQGGCELLKGVEPLELPTVSKDSDDDDVKSSPELDDMSEFNANLFAKIAANMKTSNEFKTHTTWLISGITDTSSRKWPFCLLIATNLVEALSGEHQAQLARSVVGVLKRIGGVAKDMTGEANLDNEFTDEVMRSVVQKPNGASTAWRLRVNAVFSVANISRPLNEDVEWLNDTPDEKSPSGRSIVLARQVYELINASATYQFAAVLLNSRLFQQMGANTLLFLAGVFTSPDAPDGVKRVALQHACAYLRAHSKSSGATCDFQTIIPSFLHVLQSRDEPLRSAATDSLEVLNQIMKAEKPSSIYGLDKVYGAASASLQYLEWADEKRYLAVLSEQREPLKNDPEYLSVVHSQYFGTKSESKKENKAKQRILCYLLSHVLCSPSYAVKGSILRSLEYVSDRVKLQMLLPLVEATTDTGKESLSDVKQETLRLALGTFDRTSAKELNATDSHAWAVMVRCLQQYHGQSNTIVLWNTLVNHLKSGTFHALGLHRQVELCLLLLNLGSVADDTVFGVRPLLTQVMNTTSLILTVLKEVCKPVAASPDRVRKKVKLDDTATSVPKDIAWLSPLTVLVEVLAGQQLPGSYELVSALLEVLGRVAALQDVAPSEISYLEQLLMTAIESTALQIKELPNIASSTIRVDVLVDMIRTSNPQTFNQALLLMATLARLSPDSVLHNVMPIFTFMGSNIFHRDDSYSFKVIQKTTESIVPVVVTSLKEKHSGVLALHIGARDLLRTFTDASTHIPRHRRTNFFTHLVGVLGSSDFLAPVCMLLADKSSNRVPRQKLDEAASTLSLPLTIFQHYPIQEQVTSMKVIIAEAQRLHALSIADAHPEQTFLELSFNEDHAGTPSSFRRRQCITLLAFIGHSIRQIRSKQETDVGLLDVVSLLLTMASTDENTPPESSEVIAAAQWALAEALLTISAVDFACVMLTMLRSGDKKILSGALRLLSERLPLVTPSARSDMSQNISESIELIRGILASTKDAILQSSALSAVRTIATSAQTQEEAALCVAVPTILDVLRSHPDSRDALDALPPMIVKLGPRMIQHIRQTVDICVTINQQGNIAPEVSSKSYDVLVCLLKTVPSFFGTPELKAICELFIDAERHKPSSDNADQLGKQLTKKVPSKLILSAMCSIWPPLEGLNIQSSASRFRRFFELLKRCLHVASRKDIMENLRNLYNNFQKSIAVRSVLRNESAIELEDSVVEAFIELVVKLNETSFRPLFRRLYDWGFGENSGVNEKITFTKIYKSLLDLFKELMTPYMSIVSVGLRDTLASFSAKQLSDTELWKSCIETITVSFVVDDNSYWRDERLRQISQPIITQIPVCIALRVSGGKEALSNCLLAMVDHVDEDALLRTINHDVLMHSRSEDTRVRLYALSCASEIWEQHARKLAGFATETATFILECADDDNDDVVRECKRLKDAVERETGKIEGI